MEPSLLSWHTADRPRVLVLDNYDSFTWNLVAYVQLAGAEVLVARNDELSPDDVLALAPSGLLISPGPGTPSQSGRCVEIAQRVYQSVPILGVCLGHQLIAELFGGKVGHAQQPMHGKVSAIAHNGTGLFAGLPPQFNVMRYHSLIATQLPPCLHATAHTTGQGEIMALRHSILPISGVQFHPESILTEYGHELVQNWVQSLVAG